MGLGKDVWEGVSKRHARTTQGFMQKILLHSYGQMTASSLILEGFQFRVRVSILSGLSTLFGTWMELKGEGLKVKRTNLHADLFE